MHRVLTIAALALFAVPAQADPLSDFLGFTQPARAHVRHARLHPDRNVHRLLIRRYGPDVASHSSQLVAVASRSVGARNWTGVRKWCAAGLRTWLWRSGYSALASNRAIDYARYGTRTGPHIGAIAVLRHHVGVVIGFSPRGPILLSGNHSHKVGVGAYSARRIIAYRDPV